MNRPWVKYEIKNAWNDGKGLFGIYIHNLKDPNSGTCLKGSNPFSNWNVGNQSMSSLVQCYDPNSNDAYGDMSKNMQSWVSTAIAQAKTR